MFQLSHSFIFIVRLLTWGSFPNDCSFLDQKDATSLEYKLDSFSGVYKKLTGKDVHFEFSESA